MRNHRDLLLTIPLVCVVVLATPLSAPAQTASTSQSAAPSSDAAPTVVAPALSAKDIQGLDVFGSDGQQVGKIAKVNVTDGAVRNVEVQSVGFLGFFSKTYLLPAEKL